VNSDYCLEEKKMPIVLVTMRHSPENCASFNEEARKATLALVSQQEALMKKYAIKPLGGWIVSNEHRVLFVMEVPSLDTMQQFMMEPSMRAQMAFNTIEIKVATSIEESMKLLQKQG